MVPPIRSSNSSSITHLKDGDRRPEERVKVLPVAEDLVADLLAELATEQVHAQDAGTRYQHIIRIFLSNRHKTMGKALFLKRITFVRSSSSPEDEYEQHEQREEDCDVVHGPEHDDELPAQVGEEAHQLEDAQEAEGAEDGDARALVVDAVGDGVVDLGSAAKED